MSTPRRIAGSSTGRQHEVKKIVAALLLSLAALGLAACSDDTLNPNDYTEYRVKLRDGRQVPCLMFYRELDCNWAEAK